MTRARENANISPAVGRNMIINGAMNVASRSLSMAGIGAADGYFTVDRVNFAQATNAGRLTMSQTADGPNGISANCLKLDCTTVDTSIAADEAALLQWKLEGQNLQRIGKGVAGAKQLAVSFYVKGNASATYTCELFDNDNGRCNGQTFAVTTDWTRVELIFPADEDDGSSPLDDDNAWSFSINIWIHAGATYTGGTFTNGTWANSSSANIRVGSQSSFFDATTRTFFITGVQMEVGPVATDFEQEEISTTLQKCQRYYQRIQADSDTYKHFGLHFCAVDVGGTSYGTAAIPLVTTMRAIPTLVTTGTVSNYSVVAKNTNFACTALSIDTGIDDGTISGNMYINAYTGSGNTAGAAGALRANNTASAFIAVDAEL